MKRLISCLLTAVVMFGALPTVDVWASPEISITPFISGPKLMLKGTDEIPYTELHLEIDQSYYLSNISNYNHEFTVRIDGATFDKAGHSYDKSDFEKLVYTGWINDSVEVEITNFKSDEFTFVLKDGLLKKGDKVVIILDSTLNSKSSNSYATVAVYSDFYNMEAESYTSVTEHGFYANLDKTVKIVAGESVALDSKGIEINPVVQNAYLAGTAFELGISSGFTFSDKSEIKAVSSGNVVTYGEIKNGKIYIAAPSNDSFSLQGIIITASENVSTGDVAQIKVYSQGMVANVNSNSSSIQQATEGSKPEEKEDEIIPEVEEDEELEENEELEEQEENEEDTEDEDTTIEPEEEIVDIAELFSYKVEIPVGRKVMSVGSETINIDVPAYIHSAGYTMLPVRPVADILGDNATIEWDENSKQVIIDIPKANRQIIMTVGSSFYTINGAEVPIIGVPMEIVDDRAFLPVRPLANALGIIDIEWDENNKIVILNGNQ